MDGDSFVHGNGTFVVSGGLPLPDIVRPNVQIEGGAVESTRASSRFGDVTIRNGTLRFRMTSTNAVIANATLTINGGELSIPEVLPNAGMHPAHLHTKCATPTALNSACSVRLSGAAAPSAGTLTSSRGSARTSTVVRSTSRHCARDQLRTCCGHRRRHHERARRADNQGHDADGVAVDVQCAACVP